MVPIYSVLFREDVVMCFDDEHGDDCGQCSRHVRSRIFNTRRHAMAQRMPTVQRNESGDTGCRERSASPLVFLPVLRRMCNSCCMRPSSQYDAPCLYAAGPGTHASHMLHSQSVGLRCCGVRSVVHVRRKHEFLTPWLCAYRKPYNTPNTRLRRT